MARIGLIVSIGFLSACIEDPDSLDGVADDELAADEVAAHEVPLDPAIDGLSPAELARQRPDLVVPEAPDRAAPIVPTRRAAGSFGFSGGLFGSSEDRIVGPSSCGAGFVRAHGTASALGDGHCYVRRWYSSSPTDCRLVVHSGASSLANGTCYWEAFAYSLRTFSYSAANTASATVNTTNVTVNLNAGQAIEVGTCGLPLAGGSGDTYLRLIGPGGALLSHNDDFSAGSGCPNDDGDDDDHLLSNLEYTVPPGAAGNYVIKAGCFSGRQCSGTVAYAITP